jgi:hypothetical protein
MPVTQLTVIALAHSGCLCLHKRLNKLANTMTWWPLSKEMTEQSCETAITKLFRPIAAELGLELLRVRDIALNDDSPYLALLGERGGAPVQLYEVVSQTFTLRVRVGVGPWTDREKTSLVVSLVPTEMKHDKWDAMTDEIGVYVIAHYYGDTSEYRNIYDQSSFEKEAQQASRLVQKFCKSFLLGQADDYSKIRQQLDERIREDGERIRKQMANLPSNVKPMWKREGESHSEWIQRLEIERKAAEARLRKKHD